MFFNSFGQLLTGSRKARGHERWTLPSSDSGASLLPGAGGADHLHCGFRSGITFARRFQGAAISFGQRLSIRSAVLLRELLARRPHLQKLGGCVIEGASFKRSLDVG